MHYYYWLPLITPGLVVSLTKLFDSIVFNFSAISRLEVQNVASMFVIICGCFRSIRTHFFRYMSIYLTVVGQNHRRVAKGNTKSREVAGALAGTAPSSTARNSVTRLCGTEAGDQRGGEWEPIKISSEIQTVGLYPENHPSPQAFWPKFGIAMEKLNQHKRP